MQKAEFIKKNRGKDKIPGRPIRLNRQKLIVKPGKNYAELLLFGDVHLGYPTANLEKAKAMLDYALKNGVYVLLIGDLLESGLRDSVGDSVYRQRLNPQKQMEEMIEILEPLAKKNLIIGMHSGNHENRITKATSIDITKLMARILGVRYLKYSCWSVLSINGMSYSMYSTHGCTGSRFKHTKLKSVMDLCAWIESDILAMAHTHSIGSEPVIKQYFDSHLKRIVEKKQYVVMTGAYLTWDDSYAQQNNYPITKIGSPKLKLFSDKKDIHISF